MTQAQTETRRARDPDQHVWVETSPKWVRGIAEGQVIVDSKRAVLLHETGHIPVYYFPMEDVRMELFEPTDRTTQCPYKGEARYWTLKVGERVEKNAIWSYPKRLEEEDADLSGYVAFYWDKIDAWFEENEQVYVHARDPYKRVDVIPSTRHVRVSVDGETVAETDSPTLLFETGMPVRYYIPMMDVRLDGLEPSDRVTRCPYKGEAHYHSVRTGERLHQDLVWYYTYPTTEATGIKGFLCFFNERADIEVDGVTLERPKTQWSK